MKRFSIHPFSILFTQIMSALLCDFEVQGRQNIPSSAFIMTANHISYFDSIAALAAVRKMLPTFAAKKYQGKFIGWLMRWFTAPIWVDQQSPDRAALKQALAILENGMPIGIAPEGTRSKNRCLQQGLKGAAFIMRKANLPIIPMAFIGTEHVLHHLRPKIIVRIGRPYRLLAGQSLEEDTDRIMCAIAALMPEMYHGFYTTIP
jgi:1-acyl-sn-glycerol-3-phosphate acyltransferase